MGHIGPESRFQCFHGKNVLHQRIVEWTPFERIVSQDTETMPLMNKLTWKNEYRLVPTESGTRLTISLGDFAGPRLARKAITLTMSKGVTQFEGRVRAFAAAVEADGAEKQANAGRAPTVELTAELIRGAAGGNSKTS